MLSRSRSRARRLFLEALEPRYTLNADVDVNADGGVNILDALVIVNAVSGYADGYTPEALDVNGDTLVDVGDAEAVLDAIIAARFLQSLAEGEGEYNSPPFAGDDSFYMQHDTELSDNVSSNDWDMEGNSLTFSLVGGTSNGTLSFGGGSFTYVPNALFAGTDSFTYSVSDGSASVSATATIYVHNTAPYVGDDSYYMTHDTELDDNVSSNDWDMEGDALTFALVGGTSNGTISFNSDGSFHYVPNPLFAGTDTFTYSVTDDLVSTVGSATIYVHNTAPYVGDDSFYMTHDTELDDNVSSNDWDMEGDALTFSLVSGTSSGTLSFNGDGSFHYVPNPLFAGTDTFTYSVTDDLVSTVGTATIYVHNTAPYLGDDSFYMTHDTTLSDSVSPNDWDMEGDSLTYSLVSGPLSGTLTFNGGGSFTYVPNPLFVGTDMFVYRVSDGLVAVEGTAPIYVTNTPPMPADDAYETPSNGTRKLIVEAAGVLANDFDNDPGDQARLQAAVVASPAHGTLTMNANGGFTYEPTPGFVGHDSFTYKATDQIDESPETATVSLFVPPPVVSLSVVQGTNPAREKKEMENDTDTDFVAWLPGGWVNYDITVPFVLAGQDPAQTGFATNNVDFSLSAAGSVTIPAGSSQAVINLVVLQDERVEGSEQIAMTLQLPEGAANFRLENNVATTDIQDNDYWKWEEITGAEDWEPVTIDPAIGDAGLLDQWDSKFQGYGKYDYLDNALHVEVSGLWTHYKRVSALWIQPFVDLTHRNLDIEFEFDSLTGKILPMSGSGAEGTPRLNDATAEIDFSYSIDNSGETLHTAIVQFTAVAQVGGGWSQSQTGAVNITGKITGEGGALEGGGSYSGNVGAAGEDGGIAHKHDKTVVFKLRTFEDS